jgi:hypothetical protein
MCVTVTQSRRSFCLLVGQYRVIEISLPIVHELEVRHAHSHRVLPLHVQLHFRHASQMYCARARARDRYVKQDMIVDDELAKIVAEEQYAPAYPSANNACKRT